MIVKVTCCVCNISFGVSKEMNDNLLQSGNPFFCPSGHEQYYTDARKNNKKKILEQEIIELKDRIEHYTRIIDNQEYDINYFRRSRTAYKGHFNRIKKKYDTEFQNQV